MNCIQTIGWERYSHEQYGLKGWGSSGPYDKVYAKFGLTGSSEFMPKKKIEPWPPVCSTLLFV